MTIRNLSLLGSLFLSGLLTLGACGSSSSSGTGGTSGSLGGTSGAVGGHDNPGTGGAGGHMAGVGGRTGTGGAGGASAGCSNLPPCLTFISNCTPSGTCMSQTTGSLLTGTQTINSCYSNGVKSSDTITFDLSTGSGTGTSTYSKDGSVCFIETVAITGAAGAGGTETGTIKNGSGVAVATLTPNADGTLTVTCTGGSTYVINDSTCMPSGSSTAADCTDGICQ